MPTCPTWRVRWLSSRVRRSRRASSAGTSATAGQAAELDLGPYVNVGKREAQAIVFCTFDGTDTDETVTFKLQESATTVSSDYGDVTDGDFAAVAAESAMAIETIKFLPTKRYLRGYATPTGTTVTYHFAIAVVLQGRFDT